MVWVVCKWSIYFPFQENLCLVGTTTTTATTRLYTTCYNLKIYERILTWIAPDLLNPFLVTFIQTYSQVLDGFQIYIFKNTSTTSRSMRESLQVLKRSH